MNRRIAMLQWTIAGVLWLYILYRALFFSITQDEAYSYFLAKTDYWRAMPGSANTHWLNTLCMRLFLLLPGVDHPWKLRMLSVLAWPLYTFSVIQLTRMFRHQWVAIGFFAVALFNPFLLFFFSLGRGYAVACACIFYCLWLAAKRLVIPDTDPKKWLPVFIWACLAVWCNFTALYFLLSLSLVYLFFLFKQKQLNIIIKRSSRTLVSVVLLTICFSSASLLFIHYHSGDLEHGGKTNMVASLFGSLALRSIYVSMSLSVAKWAGILVFVMLVAAIITALYRYWKSKQADHFLFPGLIMLCMVLLNVCFHILFGTPYLLDRTTLIIFPVLMLGLFLFFDLLARRIPVPIRATVVSILMIVILFNFYRSFNLSFFTEWPTQEHAMESYDYLQKVNARNVGMDIWQYSVLHNYYRVAYPGRYLFSYRMLRYRDLTDSAAWKLHDFDHLLLSPAYTDKNKHLEKWKVLLYFPDTRTCILTNQKDPRP